MVSTFRSSYRTAAEIEVALQRCANISSINLTNSSVSDEALHALIDAFEGGRGSKLEVPNLNLNALTYETLGRLARCLCDPTKLPVLREFHLVIPTMSADTFTSIHEMLCVNDKLRYLHLPGPYPYRTNAIDPEMIKRLRIDDKCQGKTVVSKLSLRKKLAFISMPHRTPSSAPAAPRHDIDSFMASAIFCFAGDSFKRRTMWEQYP